MMWLYGYEVILYAGETNDAAVTEHVPLCTREEQKDWFPNYVPERDVFNDFDPSGKGWSIWNIRAAHEVRERCERGDVLCLTMGTTHRPVAELCSDLFHVETGIGYSGVWAPFRVYESWAWRNYITGRYGPDDTHKAYDTVIPRAYYAKEFPLGKGDGGYFAFVGRVTERKGPHIAAAVCDMLGAPLKIAGQGHMDLPGDVEFLGTLGPKERTELLRGAIATFCPSQYLEPLCGVSIESQLVGTPVIASNWGALVENVQGEGGFRCDILSDYIRAAQLAPNLDRAEIRRRAVARWSTEAVSEKFDIYFEQLQNLRGEGWYSIPEGMLST